MNFQVHFNAEALLTLFKFHKPAPHFIGLQSSLKLTSCIPPFHKKLTHRMLIFLMNAAGMSNVCNQNRTSTLMTVCINSVLPTKYRSLELQLCSLLLIFAMRSPYPAFVIILEDRRIPRYFTGKLPFSTCSSLCIISLF